ncbi:MAG: hypothetical protein RLY21_458 [Planctomycetota bacterium]
MLSILVSLSLALPPSATPLPLAVVAPPTPAPAAPTIPRDVFVSEKPKDAKPVSAAKKSAKKGETVVIEAKIGGRAEPFVKNRAIFMVADRSLKSCDEIPGDTCPKPWDYCCEPAESKKANMMTVQFVDKDGKPLKVGAQGVEGLEPLALVVFEGTVAEVDDKGNFVVHVTKMFVEKPAKK